MASQPTLPVSLTEQQAAAALHAGGPLLIIAGPGSGKTEVIAWRVAHMVRDRGVRPDHLLVLTFTNKAALGLKDRIQGKLPEVNVELMQVSTFHAFCADLLRRFRQQSALPRGFRILDDTGQFLFVYSNRKALGLDEIVKGRPHDFYSSVLHTFNLATEELVDPAGLEAWCAGNLCNCGDDQGDLWRERSTVAAAYRGYLGLLGEVRALDFALLQRHALDLLERHPDIAAGLRAQYAEILVDEYQDTNAAQDRLLGLLAGDGRHLTVVGDDDQSIYRFRGATVRNIQTFPSRYANTTVIRLEHNFRSRDPIVHGSQEVIVHNPARYPKNLVSTRGEGSDMLLVYERSAGEEATAVIDLLARLHAAGRIRRWGDVAILLRSVSSYAGPYLTALMAAGIPHLVTGDRSFFERPEIAQLYDLFNFLGASKPWGDRFLRHPIVGLDPGTAHGLAAYKGNLLDVATPEGLAEIGVSDAGDQVKLLTLLDLKRRVQAQQQSSLLQVFYGLLAGTGCVSRFEAEGDGETLANLGVFSRIVAAWDEHGTSRNFYPFQEYLKLMKEGGLDPVHLPPEDAVQVMTIHQAKGLEWPVVVVGAAMNGRLPGQYRKDRYEIPHCLCASGEPEVDDPHLVDERKLFYVAATRARDLLVVGTADVVNKRGGGPSPFVREMFGQDLVTAADMSRKRVDEIESQRPGREGPRPRHSFSELAYYLQCPMRYKLANVYGLVAPWLDPVDFGTNVHRALEAIHTRTLAGNPPAEEELAEIVAANWVAGHHADTETQEGAQRAAVNQLRRYLREHASALAHVTQAETGFAYALGDHVLLGRIDLLRDGDTGIEVVDFKTSAQLSIEAEGIDLQLDVYALGAEAALTQPVAHQTVHFLGDGRVVSGHWTPERKQAAETRLANLLGCIDAGQFPPKPAYCHRCQEYHAVCPYAAGGAEGEDRRP